MKKASWVLENHFVWLSITCRGLGGGGNTSGKTDCGQIVMSLRCHQFSPKTSASRALAKATTIFTRTSLWGLPFYGGLGIRLLQKVQSGEMIPGR